MSVIGTNAAASVAQTAHAAQQVAREKDKKHADRAHDDVRLSQKFAEKLHDAEDAADPDGQLPDRQAPGYEELYQQRLANPHQNAAAADSAAKHPGAAGVDAGFPTGVDAFGMPTFQHIDLKA